MIEAFLMCMAFPFVLLFGIPLAISVMNFFLNQREWDEVDYLEDGTIRKAIWRRKE